MSPTSTLPASLTSPLKYYPTPTQIYATVNELLERTNYSVEIVHRTIDLMGKIAAFYYFTPSTWRRCLVGCYSLSVRYLDPEVYLLAQISGATGIAVAVLKKMETDLQQCLEIWWEGEVDSQE